MIFVFVYFDEKLYVKIVFCVFKYLVSIKEKKKKKIKRKLFLVNRKFLICLFETFSSKILLTNYII